MSVKSFPIFETGNNPLPLERMAMKEPTVGNDGLCAADIRELKSYVAAESAKGRKKSEIVVEVAKKYNRSGPWVYQVLNGSIWKGV